MHFNQESLRVCQSSLMLIIEAKKYFHGHNNYNIAIFVTFYLLERTSINVGGLDPYLHIMGCKLHL